VYWNTHKIQLRNNVQEQFEQALKATGIPFRTPLKTRILNNTELKNETHAITPPIKKEDPQQPIVPPKTDLEKYQEPYFSIVERLKTLTTKIDNGEIIDFYTLITKIMLDKKLVKSGGILSSLSRRINNLYFARNHVKPKTKSIIYQPPSVGYDKRINVNIFSETDYNNWIDHFIYNECFDLDKKIYFDTKTLSPEKNLKLKEKYSDPKAIFLMTKEEKHT
jgi:hypothetical protein